MTRRLAARSRPGAGSSEPQARIDRAVGRQQVGRAEHRVVVSWSTIEWRTYDRAMSASWSPSPKNSWPTTLSDSDWPNWFDCSGGVDRGLGAGLEVVEDAPRSGRGRPPASRAAGRGVLDRALRAGRPRGAGRPGSSGTAAAVSARIVRSEPNPTARSRTRAGSPWRTSSGWPSPSAAEDVAADRRRQQRAARDAAPGTAARRREDAEVDLRRALGRARRAADDRDLVDDDVAAAQERPEGVGADGEDDDEERHRDPRPLALVEAPEDEVVDRADQHDVGDEQGDQAADRRQGQRRQLRDRADQQAVVDDREAADGPGRQEAPPQAPAELRSWRSSRPSGRTRAASPSRCRRSARRPRPGRRPWRAPGRRPSSPDRAGRRRRRRRQLAEQAAQARRGDVGRDLRPVGQERVGERRQRLRARRSRRR